MEPLTVTLDNARERLFRFMEAAYRMYFFSLCGVRGLPSPSRTGFRRAQAGFVIHRPDHVEDLVL
jgi:hypothetical protein